ncbi:MAG: hypothetical protein K2X77_07275 [Candidatus Obscuribacterales bacterium]|nr:hypothetical protein [Candidatus Obscuribacterales bacterium]
MSLISRCLCICVTAMLFFAQSLNAQSASSVSRDSSYSKAQPLSALAKMPVKELTVFKDGHSFVLHEGSMPVDADGNVVMDYLPTPVLGTFWPFSNDKDAKLSAVVASQRKVLIPKTALSVQQFIQANPGAQVQVTEIRNPGSQGASTITYDAQIVGIPVRTSEELESTNPPNSGERLPEYGDLVLLKTASGTATVPLNKIEYITFKENFESKVSSTEFRNLLTLKMDWKGQPGKNADVGMMYLQRGLRWIPEYKISIDGKGNAHLKLQATLVNDLTDLNDVTMNLVVGVPTFAFKDDTDPIALQQVLVETARRATRSEFRNSMSNAIMSQVASFEADDSASTPQGPEVTGSEKNEDLFVFTVKHVTIRKGQRLVLPVYESDLKYKDVYTLTLPFSPPPEVVQHFNQSQQSQVERLLKAPKFMHKIRINNNSDFPLTTAPALLLKNEKVLAQGMMTYTAVGAPNDLELTTAVDLKVRKQDKEIKRTPNAATWQGDQYGKIDLEGTITATNYGPQPADVEIVRYVLGRVGTADRNGKADMVNIFEDYEFLPNGSPELPIWWNWYSWPNWWNRFNGVGKISWKETIKPKETADFHYTWHYFWR